MITRETIESILLERLAGTSIFPVEIEIATGNRISISVDKPEGISIDECADISRHINEVLDREVEDYELEVASPGLSSPFKVPLQYEKNLGKEVEMVFRDGKKLKGKLLSFNNLGMEIEYMKTIKPEGAKRKKKTIVQEFFEFQNIKTTKSVVSFK